MLFITSSPIWVFLPVFKLNGSIVPSSLYPVYITFLSSVMHVPPRLNHLLNSNFRFPIFFLRRAFWITPMSSVTHFFFSYTKHCYEESLIDEYIRFPYTVLNNFLWICISKFWRRNIQLSTFSSYQHLETSAMAQRIKALIAKSSELLSILGTTQWKERTNSWKLSSYCNVCTVFVEFLLLW